MTIQFYPEELDYVNATLHPRMRPPEDTSFLGTFCLACLRADGDNYEVLRPALLALRIKYPANAELLAREREGRRLEGLAG